MIFKIEETVNEPMTSQHYVDTIKIVLIMQLMLRLQTSSLLYLPLIPTCQMEIKMPSHLRKQLLIIFEKISNITPKRVLVLQHLVAHPALLQVKEIVMNKRMHS